MCRLVAPRGPCCWAKEFPYLPHKSGDAVMRMIGLLIIQIRGRIVPTKVVFIGQVGVWCILLSFAGGSSTGPRFPLFLLPVTPLSLAGMLARPCALLILCLLSHGHLAPGWTCRMAN